MGVYSMAIPANSFVPGKPAGAKRSAAMSSHMPPPAGRSPKETKGRNSTLLPVRPSPEQKPVRVHANLHNAAEQEAQLVLVRRCIAGDSDAWASLVRSQNRRVYALCYRFTGSATDAEDLTQEVFLKLYRNLSSFDLEKGSFHTWLTTLTRNLLVDHFRRSRQERATSSLDQGWDAAAGDDTMPPPVERLEDSRPSQHSRVLNQQLYDLIQQALKHLSPELREAVILRDLEDLDYKEIAQILRIPEGTVKSRISRGRMELARLLERSKGQVM